MLFFGVGSMYTEYGVASLSISDRLSLDRYGGMLPRSSLGLYGVLARQFCVLKDFRNPTSLVRQTTADQAVRYSVLGPEYEVLAC